MSEPESANNAARTARTSATIGSCHRSSGSCRSVIAVLHQFIRRAQYRGLIALLTTHSLHASTKRGVGDVRYVPRQKKIDPVVGRDRDVRRINGRCRRERHLLDQRRGQFRRFIGDIQQRQLGNKCQPGWPSS